MTLLIGESFSVGPSSLNISENSEFASYGLTYFSNNSVCEITSKSYTNWKGYSYRVYSIEALEEGTFEFTLSATYKDLNSYKSVSKSYKITVLEKYPVDSQKEIIVTVGESFTINPYADWGIPFADLLYSSDYSISDELAFDITPHGINMQNGTYKYCELRALKPGIYTYEETINYMKEVSEIPGASGPKWNTRLTVLYVIHVVDVIQISIPNNLSLIVGEELTLSPIITDSRATTTLTWQSSNTSVATVSENGTISAFNVGTTIITCTAHNGVLAQCVITVNPVLTTGVSLNTSSSELIVGKDFQLHATITPTNATYPGVTWSSTNSSVATVDGNGLVTAVGSGQCSITATTTDGTNLKATCQINVLSNVLYVDDAVGVPSGTIVLPIQLKNTTAITGLQFELQLPEGVTVAEDAAGKLQASFSDRAADQSISVSKLSNGNYQYVVFSGTSAALTGTEGAIAYTTLRVSENMTVGDYTIGIKEVELTKTDGTSLHHKDWTSKLTLTEVLLGDVNGDGKITVTDAVGIVNHVLHRTPSVFIMKAADVNQNGNITISDAVMIINIVLNK